MKKLLLFLLFFSALHLHTQAQTVAKDSIMVADSISKKKAIAKAYEDSLDNALLAKASYPLIKSSKYSGVMPVSDISEKADASQRYKILMEVTMGIKDSAEAKEINGALGEVARIINLHSAAGIPKKNMDIVVVAHGGILRSLFTDSAYSKKYKTNNPNDSLLNELLGMGVKFIACGQAMNFMNVQKEQMFPWVKVAISAQTVITDYQLRGYIHRDLSTPK